MRMSWHWLTTEHIDRSLTRVCSYQSGKQVFVRTTAGGLGT